MEFSFATDGTNNAYLERIIQTSVEVELSEINYCLQTCNIAAKAHLNPNISFSQRLCLCMFR